MGSQINEASSLVDKTMSLTFQIRFMFSTWGLGECSALHQSSGSIHGLEWWNCKTVCLDCQLLYTWKSVAPQGCSSFYENINFHQFLLSVSLVHPQGISLIMICTKWTSLSSQTPRDKFFCSCHGNKIWFLLVNTVALLFFTCLLS